MTNIQPIIDEKIAEPEKSSNAQRRMATIMDEAEANLSVNDTRSNSETLEKSCTFDPNNVPKNENIHAPRPNNATRLEAPQKRIAALEAQYQQAREALERIVERSRNFELGTSKVVDMRNLASAALKETLPRHPVDNGGKSDG